MIPGPYLLFLADKRSAKVAEGLRTWRPELCLGQLRTADAAIDLGLPDMTVEEAVAAGAKTMIIGVANRGGRLSRKWLPTLEAALDAGLDIASGLHDQLSAETRLVKRARKQGRTLHDVRVHDRRYGVGTGDARPGKRCLAVGTDSSVGKMFTMLAMERELHNRGMKATFRATGQTGIFIAGGGVPLDALIAEFMTGAIEELTPANDPDHWDLVEGQGGIMHPGSGHGTMALIYGAKPDALILCHEATRTTLRGLPATPTPDIAAMGALSLQLARIANPNCVIAGVSLNTRHMSERKALDHLRRVEARLGLPTVDPIRQGAGRLVDALERIGAAPSFDAPTLDAAGDAPAEARPRTKATRPAPAPVHA